MADASDRMAVTRRRLVASRGEIADGVEGIQRLLEQRRAQLAGREAQLQASVVAALGACPYKGLARFEAADAANFFGRERLVAELVARLAESPLLAVVGPSGSGKSSLVRAGPAAGPGRRDAARGPTVALHHPLPGSTPRPGAGPPPPRRRPAPRVSRGSCSSTSSKKRSPPAPTVPSRRSSSAACSISSTGPTRRWCSPSVPITSGAAPPSPSLADRLTGNDVLVGPMRDSELRRTVELPAQRAGLETEAGLVEVIVGDVAGRAGALPLLSTALAETWERREGRALTLTGYRAAGGVNGALARMAEDAYAALPAGPRAAARRLLLRLCDAGTDGDLSLRRRLPVAEAADDHDTDARAALDTLADHRLLTIDSDSVEVAHEALLREWPRLRTWLDEDVQGRAVAPAPTRRHPFLGGGRSRSVGAVPRHTVAARPPTGPQATTPS